jgi:hypothetical protein
LRAYRESKRKDLEAAAESAAREEQRYQEAVREAAALEERQRVRTQIAERHRIEQGIDLKMSMSRGDGMTPGETGRGAQSSGAPPSDVSCSSSA